MKRKIIVFALAACLLLGIAAVPASAVGGFKDVPEDSYYAAAVDWAVKCGVTKGISEDEFGADVICTRGQIVTFLWRAQGCPEPKSYENPFEDVPEGSYYEQAVLWAVEKGITNGTSEEPKLFSPDDTCTYAHIITFLWRANGSPEPKDYSPLTRGWDQELYYKQAVEWGDNNAMFEDLGGTFEAETPCTRARTVMWLYLNSRRYVSDVAGLVAAVGSNRDIFLEPGVYNLTAWIKNIMQEDPWKTGNDHAGVENTYDGWEVQILNVRNLGIHAMNPEGGKVEIVVEPRYSNVLSFFFCEYLTLDGLTLGHTPDKGYCQGAVLHFDNCGDIDLKNLDLYGCGTYGIAARNTYGLTMSDSVIRECSYGLLELYWTEATFKNVTFKDTEAVLSLLDATGSKLVFEKCVFENNTWDSYGGFLPRDDSSTLYFNGCEFDQPEYDAVHNSPRLGKTVFMTD